MYIFCDIHDARCVETFHASTSYNLKIDTKIVDAGYSSVMA